MKIIEVNYKDGIAIIDDPINDDFIEEQITLDFYEYVESVFYLEDQEPYLMVGDRIKWRDIIYTAEEYLDLLNTDEIKALYKDFKDKL